MSEQYGMFCPCCGSAEHRAMSRRTFMNLIAGSAAGLAMPSAFADTPTVPSIAYDSIANPVRLPTNTYFGECSGVALNSHGHIFVLSRGNSTGPAYGAAAAQLLEFAPDGRFVREIGHNLYAWSFAHTVKVDRHDNIWVTDKGSDMVIKFTPDGRVAMVFGRKQEASDEDTAPLKHPNPPLPSEPGRFRQVTDVAWDKAGNTYISDGYINSRVAKVDRDGNWLKSWGDRGTGPGQFHTPHSIAVDANDHVYVADRSNRRIQVFDTEGTFLRQFTIDVPVPPDARPAIGNMPSEADIAAGTFAPGSPWAICISPGPNQVLYSSDAFPGRIYKMTLDGKVLGVLGKTGKQPKQFGWIHQMACPEKNVLFVAELLNWRIQKLVLHA
ncbi:peptidyl-alpha-hydroxyglycine alpha-amidating lyase family protein [Paraburkholderia susongensis]|uniref:DNA-binding beta-propeller fold protein YncE n=1 Tax=Paraburkholderia susongensis TaxID=1515439 RepID=A0A1X7LNZ9_9BURK|nr:peptidyl-alpha-hydroxyglycine alpha-amidating lyase family protein [Paraburkholderia susongensis]SMG55237.1 DNA-binding beta-propeller fold protein YncE [Paraburkholderia susongensis]